MQTTTLKELVGPHILTAVDPILPPNLLDELRLNDSCIDSRSISFTLDGVTYSALENPEDGYRSCLDVIVVSNYLLSNTFPGCEVTANLTRSEGNLSLLNFVDNNTGKIVLTIGTDYSDDYYPHFVDYFYPENMTINQKVVSQEVSEFPRIKFID